MLVVLGPRLRAPLRRASVEEAGDKEHSTPSRPELLVLARAFQPPSVKDAARSPLNQRLRSHHVFFAAALATMRAWRAAAWLLGVFLAQLASVAAQDASCPTAGRMVLVLADASDRSAPAAVCFPRVAVEVSASCALKATPIPAAAPLRYWGKDCPTGPLQGGAVQNSDLGRALRAAFEAGLSSVGAGISSVAVAAGTVRLSTPNSSGTTVVTTYSIALSTINAAAYAPGSATGPCNGVAGCLPAGGQCPPGRFLSDSSVCGLCPAGCACPGAADQPAPCQPGYFAAAAGEAACSACPIDSYQADAGRSWCEHCPPDSYAHFEGSSGCMACYNGEPRVVVGTMDGQAGFWQPWMPAEPTPPYKGYRIARLASNALRTCGAVAHPFSTPTADTSACDSLYRRVLALETTFDCQVKLSVLGDPGCSVANQLTVVDAIYKSPSTIVSPPDLTTPFKLSIAPDATGALRLTFSSDAASCSDGLAFIDLDGAPCPEGTFPEPNPPSSSSSALKTRQCWPCDAGFKCPVGTASEQECGQGTYNQLWGAAACLTCPPGTVSREGYTSCTLCAAGTYPTADQSTCQLCPGGTFAPATGAACQACPAGTFRPEGGGDGTACTPCSPGSFSKAGATECTDCPRGYFAEDAATPDACMACPPGSFTRITGAQTCDQCPAGEFSNVSAATGCTPCGPGQITINSGLGATQCSPCPIGTFKPAGLSTNRCSSCPSGYETRVNGTGASSCSMCRPGFFAPNPNTPFCQPCTPGTFAPVAGSKACKLCSAGEVTGPLPGDARIGGAGMNATFCTPCGRRTFRPSIYAANTCIRCPAGRETRRAQGATTCTACIPGSTLLSADDFSCTSCGAGSYAVNPGFSGTCPLCSPGTYVADVGNAQCDVCPPGTFQSVSGALSCIECPVGTYSVMTGSASLKDCLPAPPGNYAEGIGNDGFVPCPAGTFQNLPGQGACKPCPPGFACPRASVKAKPCAAGFYADMKQPFCRECPRGSYQTMAQQRACKPCPAGSYCPNTKTVNPVKCPAGTFSSRLNGVTQSSCTRCPVNSFAATAGSTRCTLCPSGQWTGRLQGQVRCWSTSQALPTAAAAVTRASSSPTKR